MRLTPTQIAVTLICGRQLPPPGEARIPPNATIAERIKLGRDQLVQLRETDFDYDLEAGHEHLKESCAGGYTWGRNIILPRIMREAMERAEWQAAVRQLRAAEKI